MAPVFISYSRKDKEFVQKLVDALVAEKREVWLEATNFEPTAEWLKEIFRNIEASDTVPTLSAIQTNFIKQSDGVFSGDPDTWFCPGGYLSCFGETPLTASVSVNNVSISVLAPGLSGNKTITLTGKMSGSAKAGTYKDTDGDAGTWTATQVGPLTGTYSGTATDNLSTIPLGVTMMLVQQSDFSLTGSASITNSPCIAQLNFTTGKAVGASFYLDNGLIFFRGVPTSGNAYTFLLGYSSSPEPVGLCENYHGGGDLTRQ